MKKYKLSLPYKNKNNYLNRICQYEFRISPKSFIDFKYFFFKILDRADDFTIPVFSKPGTLFHYQKGGQSGQYKPAQTDQVVRRMQLNWMRVKYVTKEKTDLKSHI